MHLAPAGLAAALSPLVGRTAAEDQKKLAALARKPTMSSNLTTTATREILYIYKSVLAAWRDATQQALSTKHSH